MVTPRHFFLLQTTKRTIFILEPRFQCLIFFVLDSIRTVTAIDHIATMKQARGKYRSLRIDSVIPFQH